MSRPVPSFDDKRITETRKYTWDFVNDVASGETLTAGTQSVTATVLKGTDASPSSIVSGTATISGTQVVQMVTGGVEAVTYALNFQVTTSEGQVLNGVGKLYISDKVDNVAVS
jgi:hypothetical protein